MSETRRTASTAQPAPARCWFGTRFAWLAVTPLLLAWLISCAAPIREDAPGVPPQLPAALPSRVSMMIATMACLQTVDEMRACLTDGLGRNEIDYVGFDQVTLAQCIDRVITAAMHDRATAGSQETRGRLVESLELYFAAMREAMFRRTAGAAPCLPYIR